MGAEQGINVTCSVSRLPKDAHRGLRPRRTQGMPPPPPPRGRWPSSRGYDPWLGPHPSSPETWVLPLPAVPPGASHLTFAGFSFSSVADVRSPAPPSQGGDHRHHQDGPPSRSAQPDSISRLPSRVSRAPVSPSEPWM